MKCVVPTVLSPEEQEVFECVNDDATNAAIAGCLVSKLSDHPGIGRKNIENAECIASATNLDDGAACLGVDTSQIAHCANDVPRTALSTECATAIFGDKPGARAAACLTEAANRDPEALVACLSQVSPDAEKVSSAVGCVTRAPDKATAIETCTIGILDEKTRTGTACLLRSEGETAQVITCAATVLLPPEEARVVSCVTESAATGGGGGAMLTSGVMCAVGPRLNPEWRMAAECAVNSGGEPLTFAGCTAGRLAVAELRKCVSGKFGSANGCFGPNNTIRKTFETVANDLKNGPGPNNEVVKAFNGAAQVAGDVGDAIGKAFSGL